MDNPSSAPPHPDPPVIDLKSIIHPTESLSPALRTLRRSFELLSVSYFVTMFGPAIGFSEFSVRVSPARGFFLMWACPSQDRLPRLFV